MRVIEEWSRALPPSIGYSVSQPSAEMPSRKTGVRERVGVLSYPPLYKLQPFFP